MPTPVGPRHGHDGLVLADNAQVQLLGQLQQLLAFGLQEPGHGDAGPAGDDLGDVVGADLLAQQALFVLLDAGAFLKLLSEAGQGRIGQLRGAAEVAGALGLVDLVPRGLDLGLEAADPVDLALLALPLLAQGGLLGPKLRKLVLQLAEALAGGLVLLLAQGLALDLELHGLAVHLVELRGQRVDFGADHGAGLVDEVDGLVGQLPVGDVATGEHHSLYQGGVADAHAVVHLEALLEAPEDGDGVLDAGLLDQDRLEAALQGRILFDVLAVLVHGGGADAVQLAPGQHGLEQVARIHGALGLAGAHDGVQLVDEEDDLALALLDFLEHGLEALFELAAVLGARDEGAHVQGEELVALEVLGHVPFDDAEGQAFHYGGLADAGLAGRPRR